MFLTILVAKLNLHKKLGSQDNKKTKKSRSRRVRHLRTRKWGQVKRKCQRIMRKIIPRSIFKVMFYI